MLLSPSHDFPPSLALMARAARLRRQRLAGVAPERPSAAKRRAEHRRRYAGDPPRYVFEVLGWRITPQQEAALHHAEEYDRALLPSANNVGKTFIISAYGVYRYDAVASLPDEDRGLEEQGAQILLPGPDTDTIFATIYSAMLEHMARAESRGFAMPGRRSDRSVLCAVRPRWFVEGFAPRADAKRDVAHSASGRHHRNQVALIEEGQGVEERVWRAVEGMCSGAGNKVISSYNPTLASGPAYERERTGSYRALHLSAFDHPNVRSRANDIPEAVDFSKIDSRVRNECRDRGRWPDVQPDPDHDDFLYALPAPGTEECGGRTDGVIGHPAAPVHVYRPTVALFSAQVLGRYPRTSDSGLFDVASWEAAVARWKARRAPEGKPSAVGFDVAGDSTASDDSVAMPRWGEHAEALLRVYIEARNGRDDALLAEIVDKRRIYLGEPLVLHKGDGHHLAEQVFRRWGSVPWNVDAGWGQSVIDQARNVLRIDVADVSFAASPPAPLAGQDWPENMRAAMYLWLSMLLRLGLVDVPDDPILREELFAHEKKRGSGRVVERRDPRRGTVKERVETVLITPKDDVKKKIGRSPDRADAAVLALVGNAPRRMQVGQLVM